MMSKAECLHRELIELVRLLDGGLADGQLNRMQCYEAVGRIEAISYELGVSRVNLVGQAREVLADGGY